MQQLKSYPFFKRTPQLVNKVVTQLFDDQPFVNHHDNVTLLNPQPTFQRRRFLAETVNQGYKVFLQLIPVNDAGHPENVVGHVQLVHQDKYLITNHNVNYIVDFDHINYIAKAD